MLPDTLSPTTVLLLLADGRAPVGGNVNSGGLEPALQGGMSPTEVRRFLVARLRTSAAVEAGVAVVTRHAVDSDAGTAPALRIDEIEDHWAARTPGPAQRDASRLLARGYLRLARNLWPSTVFDDLDARTPRPSRGLVVGAIAALARIPAIDTARLVLYEEAQAIVAAFLKLHPTDPAIGSRWALRDLRSSRTSHRRAVRPHRSGGHPGHRWPPDRTVGRSPRIRSRKAVPCLNTPPPVRSVSASPVPSARARAR